MCELSGHEVMNHGTLELLAAGVVGAWNHSNGESYMFRKIVEPCVLENGQASTLFGALNRMYASLSMLKMVQLAEELPYGSSKP